MRALRHGLVRAYASPAAHRPLPIPFVFAAIDGFAALCERRRAGLWEEVVRFDRELLLHTSMAGEEESLGRRTLAEVLKCLEVYWRPWLAERGEIEGGEQVRAAQASGRGVLMPFPRFGMPALATPMLRRFDAHAVVAANYYEGGAGTFDSRYLRRGAAYFDLLGPGHVITRGGGAGGIFERVLGLLREGKVVTSAFDAAGSMPTPFLGRTVALASGPAKLAVAADSLVAPWVVRRRDRTSVLVFGPVLDPRDFEGDAEALQAGVAATVERWVLEQPEAVWPLLAEPGGPPLIRDAEAGPEREEHVSGRPG